MPHPQVEASITPLCRPAWSTLPTHQDLRGLIPRSRCSTGLIPMLLPTSWKTFVYPIAQYGRAGRILGEASI